jgi:hypothetical protein
MPQWLIRIATSSGRRSRRSIVIGFKGWFAASVPHALVSVAIESLQSFAREHLSRMGEVGTIHHFASYRKNAGVGLCLERRDDRPRVCEVLGRGREGAIDDGDLRGMDRKLARETLAGGRFGFGAKSVLVAKIGEDAVDRLNASGHRAGEAQRSRELVGERQFAVRIQLRRRAESGRQVFGAPTHRC